PTPNGNLMWKISTHRFRERTDFVITGNPGRAVIGPLIENLEVFCVPGDVAALEVVSTTKGDLRVVGSGKLLCPSGGELKSDLYRLRSSDSDGYFRDRQYFNRG
ncbi:MAG: hypothetical protein O2857_24475, partial [Planctomycetota bacterium]|nr:hypothetical protein [Planctomycetota bacterium]